MKKNEAAMIVTLILGSLAPLLIFITLNYLQSTILTFFVFYIGVCLLIPIMDLAVIKKMSFQEFTSVIGLKYFKNNLLTGIAYGLLFGVVVFIFFTIFNQSLFDFEQLNEVLLQWSVTKDITLPLVIVLIIINPFFEEIYWRGYILKRLCSSVKIWPSILISSVFYASYHLITTGFLFSFKYGLMLTAGIFTVGVFWGYLRIKTESIYPTIISHLLADAGIMFIYIGFIVKHLPD